ncbi:MAG: arsenate reductase family protein [Deltaproteobacteria bacterium]|nr:arsenate reductase family protein [Deltaproteobacteria bacterium]
MKFYGYSGCGTCRKAKKWLEENGLEYEEVAIRETPPSKTMLKTMLQIVGDPKRLFNTSGQDYRALGIKDKLPTMTERDVLELLSTNGNLVKRPFVLSASDGTVGFDAEVWAKKFL